jgi:hypothetical protein
MPGGPTFDDLISDDEELGEGVRELCDQLEQAGWYPRRRMGPTGMAFWPENGRRRQIVVELRYPPNDHKLEFYREHTGLALTVTTTEER